jgi:hypothetical protein
VTYSSEVFCFSYLSLSLVRNFVSFVLRVSLILMVRNFIPLSLKLYNTSEKLIIMKEKKNLLIILKFAFVYNNANKG